MSYTAANDINTNNTGISVKNTLVITVDSPDPDNLLCLIAKLRNVFSAPHFYDHIYIDVVGRPVSFGLACFDPTSKQTRSLTDDAVLEPINFRLHVKEDPKEASFHSVEDAKTLLQYKIACVEIFLVQIFGEEKMKCVTFCNGGIATCAGLSSRIHAYDEFFLIFSKSGEIRVPSLAEYVEYRDKIFSLHPEERRRIRTNHCLDGLALVPTKTYSSLVDFESDIASASTVDILIGGPFTSLVNLFKTADAPILNGPKLTVIAMACSLPGDANLLGDNFNVKTDMNAFKQVTSVLAAYKAHRPSVFFIPTGVCKAGTNKGGWLAFDSSDIVPVDATMGALVKLWADIKGGPQPMFDVLITVAPSLIPFKSSHVILDYSQIPGSHDGDMRCDLTQVDSSNATPFVVFTNEVLKDGRVTPKDALALVFGST